MGDCCLRVPPAKCAMHTGIIWSLLSGTVISFLVSVYEDIQQLSTCQRNELMVVSWYYFCLAVFNIIGSLVITKSALARNLSGLISGLVVISISMVLSGLFFFLVLVLISFESWKVEYKVVAVFMTGLAFASHVFVVHIIHTVCFYLRLQPANDFQSMPPAYITTVV